MNVIRSVTRNGRSIVLTAVLALILVYLFSIIGYMFFKDDFLVAVDEDASSTQSQSGMYIMMCLFYFILLHYIYNVLLCLVYCTYIRLLGGLDH